MPVRGPWHAGKSNSGEGGEDPQRWDNLEDVDAQGISPTFPHLKGLQEGDVASSRIKQVSPIKGTPQKGVAGASMHGKGCSTVICRQIDYGLSLYACSCMREKI